LHEVKIDGKKCRLGKITAKLGWKILHDLGRICGESLVEASDDKFAEAIASLFKNSTADEIFELLELLAPDVIVENGSLDLADYKMTMLCMKELLMYNFSDFFSPLIDALKSFQEEDISEPTKS